MIAVLLLLILFLIILYYWFLVLKDASKLNVPGPFPLPIVGNGHLFLGDPTKPVKIFNRLANEHNGAFRIYILSHRYVSLSHPKYIEALLTSTDLINKGKDYDLTRPWLGEGLLTSSGLIWKKQRKFLGPAFNTSILQSFLGIFVKNDHILRAKLLNHADGRPINLPEVINALTFDNITESVMGISFHTQSQKASEYITAVEDMCNVIATRARNPFMVSDILFNLSKYKTKMDKALDIIHKYSDEVIKSRRKTILDSNVSEVNTGAEYGVKNKLSFMDLLLLADIDGKQLNDEEIFSQVNTFMFAGHDTVATALAFILYCISNHKTVQDKIFEEQKAIFHEDMERDPTLDDLQQMRYLDLVIKEAMRLYTPVPYLQRQIVEDTNLAGLHLPKDTTIYVNIFGMHRSPAFFEDPMEFKPERFQNNLKYPVACIPFSFGPRNCIGQKFALVEMKSTISSIVKHFELLPSGREPKLTADIVLRSVNGVYVGFVPRL